MKRIQVEPTPFHPTALTTLPVKSRLHLHLTPLTSFRDFYYFLLPPTFALELPRPLSRSPETRSFRPPFHLHPSSTAAQSEENRPSSLDSKLCFQCPAPSNCTSRSSTLIGFSICTACEHQRIQLRVKTLRFPPTQSWHAFWLLLSELHLLPPVLDLTTVFVIDPIKHLAI